MLENILNIFSKSWPICLLPRRGHEWMNLESNVKNAPNMLSCMSNYLLCFKDYKKKKPF